MNTIQPIQFGQGDDMNLRDLPALSGGIFFVYVGVLHFTDTQWFVPIVPEFLGSARFWVLVSGVVEIIVGILLILPMTREWGGYASAALLVSLYPANFNMWINDIPYNGTRLTTQGHLVRLSVQFLLIIAALGFSGDLEKLGKFKK